MMVFHISADFSRNSKGLCAFIAVKGIWSSSSPQEKTGWKDEI
jgi:hypothetical protein